MSRVKQAARSSVARIVLGLALVAAVFAGSWTWSLAGPLTAAVTAQQRRSLAAVAQSASLLLAQSAERPSDIAAELVDRTDMRVTVVATDGTVLADSDTDQATMENHADRPEIAAALQGRVGTDQRASRTEGNEQLYVAVPGRLNGKRVAVRVSQPVTQVSQFVTDTRRVSVVLLLLAALIALAITVSTARYAARPIQELSRAAERMAAGDLDSTLPSVPSDLDGLATSLDVLKSQMHERLNALEAERLTLRSALDGLTDAVLVMQGDTVLLANRQANRMFGMPPGGWVDASVEQSGLPAPVAAAVLDGGTRSVDLEPDPAGRAFRVTTAPLESESPGARTIAVIADITERVRLDLVRRDFVANASHELKTPVAGIGLLAHSAEAAASDGDDEQAVTFARQIGTEVERLQRLVADLLDLSRLESMPAEEAIADVRQAIDLALVAHRGAAAAKGLPLDADLSEVRGNDVFVRLDATDLAIALDNLLDNAIAYTEAGSVRLSVTADQSIVSLAVSDTGSGIAPEHLPRVFERFYRADRSRSREAGGTGLGLSLVKHVVERNGGSVSVTSTPGEGSEFTIRLPRAT